MYINNQLLALGIGEKIGIIILLGDILFLAFTVHISSARQITYVINVTWPQGPFTSICPSFI